MGQFRSSLERPNSRGKEIAGLRILVLTRNDVVAAGGADIATMIPVIEEVFRTHSSKDYCQPLKPYLRIPGDEQGRRIIAMPAYLGGRFNTWGIKWIASNPTNPFIRNMERASAVIVLNDIESGFPLAIMEGALISASRTGAVAAIATKYLATANSSVVGIIGAGMIARSIIKGIYIVKNSIRTVRIFDLDSKRSKAFQQEIVKELGINVSTTSSAEEAANGADIIVTATTATKPYLEGEWMKQGTLLINIALRDPKFNAVQRASKIIVDDWVQANREKTTLNLMYEQGLLKDENIYAEIGDIVSGIKPGRTGDDEIILFNPMGMAMEDIGVARAVFVQAQKSKLGNYIDL